uniref:Uncharacterized protein n=1 Tax=Arion vulgaris TaxID=1028688 RepID=A0A0B6XYJ9_9EUPU
MFFFDRMKAHKQEVEEAEKKESEERKKRHVPSHSLSNDLDETDDVKLWNFVHDGEATSVVLHRTKLEVVCNGEVVKSNINVGPAGTTISFMIANQKAEITSNQSTHPDEEITYTLTVNGHCIPGTRPSYDNDERF